MMKQFSGVRTLASGLSFLEGPRWHEGRLYVSDFHTQRVLAFDEDGGAMEEIAHVPGNPSGLGFAPDGALMIVSMNDRRLLRLDNGTLSEVADLSGRTPYVTNDMLVDETGRAYVGNFGFDTVNDPEMSATSLYLIQPDGGIVTAATGLIFPNGVLKTLDGKRMIVAETFAARISQFDIAVDGTLHNRRIWADFSTAEHTTIIGSLEAGDVLPDGMAMDAEGAVWIGDAGGRGPIRAVEGGEQTGFVDTGDLAVYAVALGGSDGHTLFMCAGPPLGASDPAVDRKACLLACRVDVPAPSQG